MANVSKEDRDEMVRLVADGFARRAETPPALVVDSLAKVGVGYLIGSFGTFPPVARDVERGQLAEFLVGTYLQGTRPSPNNNYLQIVTASGKAYLTELNPAPAVPDPVVTILATMGLGFTRETDPRATRAVATNHFIDLYIAGR